MVADEYAYHVTHVNHMPSIVRNGLQPDTHRFLDDGDKAIFVEPHEEGAGVYHDPPSTVMLRFKVPKDYCWDEAPGSGDYVHYSPVHPNDLEAKHEESGKFVPLSKHPAAKVKEGLEMKTTRADALIREMLTSGTGLAEAVDALADREVALREGYHSSYTSEHELMRDVLARSGFEPIIDGPTYAEDAVQGIERYKLTGGGSVVEIDMNPDGEYRGEFSYHGANGTQRGHGHKQLSDLLRGR